MPYVEKMFGVWQVLVDPGPVLGVPVSDEGVNFHVIFCEEIDNPNEPLVLHMIAALNLIALQD